MIIKLYNAFMVSKKDKINSLFLYWLLSLIILIFSIIIIGGLTRLTNSGLSIIEWELFKGVLPPLNEITWSLYFEKYKTIPQYEIINPNMSLEEFKIIFYWEYFHRVLARFIGLFVLIPLIFFYFSKKIKTKYLKICCLIFLLIVFQGVIGWYMVKSGLVNDITVSHYRLSTHLTLAIIILSSIYWLFINILFKKDKIFFQVSKKNLYFQILIVLIFFQIIIGAFVSGLDAGMIYQNWPLMGNSYFPDDIIFYKLIDIFNFKNHSLVQFYHRNLAYILFLYTLFLTFYIYKKKIKILYLPLKILLFFMSLQIVFGITTLISGINIYLASAHQITGVLLVISAINLYYFKAN